MKPIGLDPTLHSRLGSNAHGSDQADWTQGGSVSGGRYLSGVTGIYQAAGWTATAAVAAPRDRDTFSCVAPRLSSS